LQKKPPAKAVVKVYIALAVFSALQVDIKSAQLN